MWAVIYCDNWNLSLGFKGAHLRILLIWPRLHFYRWGQTFLSKHHFPPNNMLPMTAHSLPVNPKILRCIWIEHYPCAYTLAWGEYYSLWNANNFISDYIWVSAIDETRLITYELLDPNLVSTPILCRDDKIQTFTCPQIVPLIFLSRLCFGAKHRRAHWWHFWNRDLELTPAWWQWTICHNTISDS